jgi:hypothetical protein
MKPSAPFRTTREAADALGLEAQRLASLKFARLPFNRFDRLDETTWWLSPTGEIPAYKHGKIVCTTSNFEPELFVGLYVEKGLGEEPAQMGKASTAKERRYLMDSTWLWHDFVRDLKSGEIGRVANGVEGLCDHPVTVALDGGTGVQDDWDFVSFAHSSGSLVANAGNASRKRLSPLSAAQSLPNLASLIETKISDLDWVWIDLHIGLSFSADTSDDADVWDADTIWTRVCAPWTPWLR